jgi:hypothetical protein
MNFPFKPKHLLHRHGGRITAIYSMRHQVNKPRDGRSLDGWWYIGDVEWSDGTKSAMHPIDPPCLCYEDDAGHAEVVQLGDAMMNYLREHGEWRRAKPEGWYANDRKVRRAA